MSSDKLLWIRPQLIVLARGMPEESVLTHCKRIGFDQPSGTATTQTQTGCDMGEPGNCGNCQSRGGS
jgi:hypothetical protein